MLDPQGRVVMVSGASRGIGRAIAEELQRLGCEVSAGVRDPGHAPRGCFAAHYDAVEAASADAWVEATLARFGRIDGVVNAAGILAPGNFLRGAVADIEAMWRVNMMGPLLLVRAAWNALAQGGTGRVLTIASLSGKRVGNDNTGYQTSKFAAVALTHSIRKEGWKQGIRATAVCPGYVATDMTVNATFPREEMTDAADLAVLACTAMHMPNNASVAELPVNCRAEDML